MRAFIALGSRSFLSQNESKIIVEATTSIDSITTLGITIYARRRLERIFHTLH